MREIDVRTEVAEGGGDLNRGFGICPYVIVQQLFTVLGRGEEDALFGCNGGTHLVQVSMGKFCHVGEVFRRGRCQW